MKPLAALAVIVSGATLVAAHARLQQRVRAGNRVLPKSSTGQTAFLVVKGRKYFVTPNQARFGRWGRLAGLVLAGAGAAILAIPPPSRWPKWRLVRAERNDDAPRDE
jgi:hypothetical protein